MNLSVGETVGLLLVLVLMLMLDLADGVFSERSARIGPWGTQGKEPKRVIFAATGALVYNRRAWTCAS